jgi:hypothetical protein
MSSLAAVTIGVGFPTLAVANPWNPMTSAVPGPSTIIPTAKEVPGKDFSDNPDRNAAGVADPEQVIAWDGIGGVRDSLDYDEPPNSRPQYPPPTQVDGLAASFDALFDAVVNNRSALLISVETDPTILFERATGFPAAPAGVGVWATAADLDAMNPARDTDGLELWGDNNVDDPYRYSLFGDPFTQTANPQKVAIWAYDDVGTTSIPHTLTTDLAAAIDLQFGGDGMGVYWSELVEQMDVDAIMTLGQRVIFSIRPLAVPGTPIAFDGGEIFVYENAATATKFLDHGGHLWDTGFDVMGTFLVPSENVDALEAVSQFVPEPGCCGLVVLGMLGMAGLITGRPRR